MGLIHLGLALERKIYLRIHLQPQASSCGLKV